METVEVAHKIIEFENQTTNITCMVNVHNETIGLSLSTMTYATNSFQNQQLFVSPETAAEIIVILTKAISLLNE